MEAVWVAGGQLMAAVGAIAGVRILTSLLNPDEYGRLALATSLMVLIQYVFGETLTFIAIRFYASSAQRNMIPELVATLNGFFTRITIGLLGAFALLTAGLWICGYSAWIPFLPPMFIFALFRVYGYMIEGIQSGARQRGVVAIHQAVLEWTRYLFAAILILLTVKKCETALWGFAVAMVLIAVSQWYWFRKLLMEVEGNERSPRPSVPLFKAMLEYGRPLLVIGFFTWMLTFSDRWALRINGSTRDVGLYFVLYQLGIGPIVLGCKVLVQLISPILYEKAGTNRSSADMKTVYHVNFLTAIGLVAVTACVSGLLFFIHGFLFNYLVAEEFRSVSWLWPWTVLGGGLFAAGQVFVISVMSGMDTRKLIPMKVASAGVSAICFFSGAMFFGLKGVVFGWVLFSLLHLIWAIILHYQEVKIHATNDKVVTDAF